MYRAPMWIFLLVLAMVGLASCALDNHFYDKEVNEESPMNLNFGRTS